MIKKSKSPALVSCPQRRGVCTRVYSHYISYNKPNSALRKVAKVRLTSGFEIMHILDVRVTIYKNISIVLVRGVGERFFQGRGITLSGEH